MVSRFDQKKTKHQLFHVSISLATILICMTYMQYRRNWAHLGSFWDSLIVPIVFIGELLKVILARFFGRIEDGVLTVKQRQKKLRILRHANCLVASHCSFCVRCFMPLSASFWALQCWQTTSRHLCYHC